MKRREAIQKTTWILGSAVFGPGLLGAIQSCQPKVSWEQALLVMSSDQFELAKVLTDTILPKTDTPAASEVEVPQLLDLLLKDVFDEAIQAHILEGLQQFDEQCQETTGESFVELEPKAQEDYLAPIDQEVMSQTFTAEIPFYYTFKQLVIILYFSSQEGVKQNLDYRPIPGPFEGDVALDPNDKIMIGNKMRTYGQ